jgi:predicted metalloprotease
MPKTVVSLAAAGLLALALSACSVPTAGTPSAGGAPSASGTPSAGGITAIDEAAVSAGPRDFAVPDKASGGTGRDRVLSDAKLLEPELNAFWTKELADAYGLDYVAPADFGFYEGSNNPTCGGTQIDGAGNAYYCPPDNYVAFDLDFFVTLNRGQAGDASTFLALAHEWGHSVQQNWVTQQPGRDSWQGPAVELDADCLAGVFLESEVDSGKLTLESGDAQDVFHTLFELGSMNDMDPGDHGTSEQRQQAFADGAKNGVTFCRSNY